MLKNLHLNGRVIPIPVPIKNIEHALHWLEENFAKGESLITCFKLNDQDIDFENGTDLSAIELDAESSLVVTIDSAKKLAIETLNAMRELSYRLSKRLTKK